MHAYGGRRGEGGRERQSCTVGRAQVGAFSVRIFKGWSLGDIFVGGRDLNRTLVLCFCAKMRFIPLTSSVLGWGWQMAVIGFLCFISLSREFKNWGNDRRTQELKILAWPWLVWLSGLSAILQTERSGHIPGLQARSPVGSLWEATNQCITHWCFSPSLSSSLPFSLKINK